MNRKLVFLGILLIGAITLLTGCMTQNVAPTASFTANPTSGQAPLAVSFDASASSDPDGTIASYTWAFGDGQNGSGMSGSHIYGGEGTFNVILTVIDDGGLMSTASGVITVTPPANASPTAAFTATPDSGTAQLTVMFNAATSQDSDGTISTYDWDFGDGSAHKQEVAVTHTYLSSGSYAAILTVTDNGGAQDVETHTITVNSPGNSVPTASFTTDPLLNIIFANPPVTVDFDANASSDTDGTISSYNWVFGDGGTATGVTTSHTYTTSGTYTIILTVIDNSGAPASATKSIKILNLQLLQPPLIPILLPYTPIPHL